MCQVMAECNCSCRYRGICSSLAFTKVPLSFSTVMHNLLGKPLPVAPPSLQPVSCLGLGCSQQVCAAARPPCSPQRGFTSSSLPWLKPGPAALVSTSCRSLSQPGPSARGWKQLLVFLAGSVHTFLLGQLGVARKECRASWKR